jgi:hypothetical protein
VCVLLVECMHLSVYVGMCVIYVYMCIYVHMYVYVYMHMCVCVCACVDSGTRVQKYCRPD